jgi:hypothetical protein
LWCYPAKSRQACLHGPKAYEWSSSILFILSVDRK